MKFKSLYLSVAAQLMSLAIMTSCTNNHEFRLNQVDQSFTAAQESKKTQEFQTSVGKDQTQAFRAAQEVKSKFDLLWVIDNSASMEPSQLKLRDGLSRFAKKYLRTDWDIQIAVITTDTFLAHPAFKNYLSSPTKKKSDPKSPYLKNLLTSLSTGVHSANDTHLVSLFDVQTGAFKAPLKPTDLIPTLGPDYAKLIPGKKIHDGPLPTLCFEGNYLGFGAIFKAPVNCGQREEVETLDGVAHFKNSGIESCVNAPGKTSINQCINTLLNDTVHSGKPILSTVPDKLSSTQEWTENLARDFRINASVGTSGSQSERGLSSLLQLIADNEKPDSDHRFFRAGSKRMIVFISDEDDQSVKTPETPGPDFSPISNYVNHCKRVFDKYTYKISICPKAEDLIPVNEIKESIDQFFLSLDGTRDNPNYTVVSIVATQWETLSGFGVVDITDSKGQAKTSTHQDYGRRYIELGSLVANGSYAVDIAADDYSEILDQIGKAVSKGFKTYVLNPAPTENEKISVLIVGKAGQETLLGPDAYTLSGSTLTISDETLVNQFKPDDSLVVQYEARKFSRFDLERGPETNETITISIQHADGSTTQLSANQFQITEKTLAITDPQVVSALQPADTIKTKFEMRRLNEFVLSRFPTGEVDMIVKIVRANGSELFLTRGQYHVQGKLLIVDDPTITASLTASDRVLVNYQPKTVQ